MDTDSEPDFEVAKYPVTLDLPGGDAASICDAQMAIRREFRDSVKWKKLRCRKVSLLSEADKGSVYILEVGHTVEFDWTWEGSIAFGCNRFGYNLDLIDLILSFPKNHCFS